VVLHPEDQLQTYHPTASRARWSSSTQSERNRSEGDTDPESAQYEGWEPGYLRTGEEGGLNREPNEQSSGHRNQHPGLQPVTPRRNRLLPTRPVYFFAHANLIDHGDLQSELEHSQHQHQRGSSFALS
jgi:hypothetical protein